jgi:predicted nucleic acid-binding protein
MLLYLDNSVLNRPFDDQSQARIWLETLSLSLILGLIESGEAECVCSPIHLLENNRNPLAVRRHWVSECLRRAHHRVHLFPAIHTRAQALEASGVKPLDALHVACAEAAGATHFLTCDDRLIRRYSGPLTVQTPATFITTISQP